MTSKKTTLLIAIILFCSLILVKNFYYWQSQPCPISNTLIIGTAAGYAPYVSINEQGAYEGFDIDIAHALAAAMDKKLEIKDLGSMTSLMMALEQRSIDAILWGISITKNRQAAFEMIHYFGNPTTHYPLIFWNNAPSEISDFASLKGMTICAEPGSSQYDVLKQYPEITMLPVDKVDDALMHLQYGSATAALLDPVIAQKFKAKFPNITIVNMPLPDSHQVSGIGIVLKKKSPLKAALEDAVAFLTQHGVIAQRAQAWGLS